jgi:DNA mismatch repair protein MutL
LVNLKQQKKQEVIKSAYLNHAVASAFQEMIASDSFPTYVLFIDLDPAQVDINVHPTKQEIKFEDEKIVYAFVQSAVKHALAQFSITPTLDFDLDPNIQGLDAVSKPFTAEQKSQASSSSLYQTFTQKHAAHKIDPTQKSELKNWRTFYERDKPIDEKQEIVPANRQQPTINESDFTQLHNTYIVTSTNQGILLIHQQNAHERVLYERYLLAVDGKAMAIQRSLFPSTLQLSTQDAVLLEDLLPDLLHLGFHIEPFGKNSFVIQGTPADVEQGNESIAIELLLEQFKHYSSDLKYSKREKLIRSLARQHSIKAGRSLTQKEMKQLVEDLFACNQPNATSNGLPVYMELKKEELEKMFGR